MSSSMGEAEYYPCKHRREGKGDGCQDFDPSDGDPWICDCCGCHRNFHVVVFSEDSRYGMCQEGIDKLCGNDGCQAFIPSTTPREKHCACCLHHRNFHKPLNSQNSGPLTKCPSENMRPDSSSEPSGPRMYGSNSKSPYFLFAKECHFP